MFNIVINHICYEFYSFIFELQLLCSQLLMATKVSHASGHVKMNILAEFADAWLSLVLCHIIVGCLAEQPTPFSWAIYC